MKDINMEILAMTSIAPASLTGDTEGTVVDVSGADSIEVIVPVGVVTTADADNRFDILAKFGDSADGSDAAEVTGSYLDPKSESNVTWDRKINATTEGPLVYQFGLKNLNNNRYLRIVADETGTASAVLGAVVVLGKLRHQAALS